MGRRIEGEWSGFQSSRNRTARLISPCPPYRRHMQLQNLVLTAWGLTQETGRPFAGRLALPRLSRLLSSGCSVRPLQAAAGLEASGMIQVSVTTMTSSAP